MIKERNATLALPADVVARGEALTSALREARDALADQLENDLEGCCPHNEDGSRDESQMDGLSRPFIEETRALVGRLDAALSAAPTDAVARMVAEETEACAQIAESVLKCANQAEKRGQFDNGWADASGRIAEHIRARIPSAHRERTEAERAVFDALVKSCMLKSVNHPGRTGGEVTIGFEFLADASELHSAIANYGVMLKKAEAAMAARLSLSDTPDGKVG